MMFSPRIPPIENPREDWEDFYQSHFSGERLYSNIELKVLSNIKAQLLIEDIVTQNSRMKVSLSVSR